MMDEDKSEAFKAEVKTEKLNEKTDLGEDVDSADESDGGTTKAIDRVITEDIEIIQVKKNN